MHGVAEGKPEADPLHPHAGYEDADFDDDEDIEF